jgi:toxin ParE1/3/4
VEISIEWSDLSEKRLKEIFDYYTSSANYGIARKIVNQIVDHVSVLETNPLAGQKEELLAHYPEEYRYLVQSNYKIIYWFASGKITIASVFDCRQNPIKMKKL